VKWEEGWSCLFKVLNFITDSDLSKVIYIRNQGHTILEAINRKLSHYPHHIGQIVFIGKMLRVRIEKTFDPVKVFRAIKEKIAKETEMNQIEQVAKS